MEEYLSEQTSQRTVQLQGQRKDLHHLLFHNRQYQLADEYYHLPDQPCPGFKKLPDCAHYHSSLCDSDHSGRKYFLRILVQGQGEIGYIARQINSLIEHVEQESRREQNEQLQLEKKATSDLLTGIYNKQSINDCVKRMVSRANDMKAKVVVGFMDVDNFKDFNTYYGHQQGDEVLKYVTGCLRESISGNVGRNGGDEFMFCMLERRNTDDVKLVLERLQNKIRKGVVNTETGRVMKVTCSIGVVVALGTETEYEDLIHEADMAMYEVKEKGKDSYVVRYKIEGTV